MQKECLEIKNVQTFLMRNPYLFIAREYLGYQRFVLATVISTRGSTPQKPGSSAIFSEGSLVYGTIGGGVLEGRVAKIASKASLSEVSGLYHFDLDKDIDYKEDAICGGIAEVLIDAKPEIHLDVYRKAGELVGRDAPCVIITVFMHSVGKDPGIERFVYDPSGPDTLPESLGLPVREKATNLISGSAAQNYSFENLSLQTDKGEMSVFMEPLFPATRLVIAGAGHIGRALCRLAGRLDFHVTVIDDRSEFANSDNLPEADEIIAGNIGSAVSSIKKDSNTFIVIVTRGHNDDSEALRNCITGEAAYIGMIGSRTKIEKMHRNFIGNGWATEEQWSFIHAPVGLEIYSQSVEEIAVSIAAELVLERNRKK